MSEDNKRFFVGGAMPPPGFEWQIGKRARDIAFHARIARYLLDNPDTRDKEILTVLMEMIRDGDLVTTKQQEEISIEDIVKNIGLFGL
jgi:hypothetical protein